MTEPASDRPARAVPTPAKRGHAARGGRILVAGLAAGSGLGLVGAMSAAARAPEGPQPQAVRRVVVDRTTGEAVPADPMADGTASTPSEPAPLPLPPPLDPQPAPPVTQSQGS